MKQYNYTREELREIVRFIKHHTTCVHDLVGYYRVMNTIEKFAGGDYQEVEFYLNQMNLTEFEIIKEYDDDDVSDWDIMLDGYMVDCIPICMDFKTKPISEAIRRLPELTIVFEYDKVIKTLRSQYKDQEIENIILELGRVGFCIGTFRYCGDSEGTLGDVFVQCR